MNKRVTERVTKKVERESNNPKIKSECPLCGCIGVFHSCRYPMFDWNKRELPTGAMFYCNNKDCECISWIDEYDETDF